MSICIAECLKQSSQLETVSDSARLDIEVLLAAVLKKDRAYLYTWPEAVLNDDQQALFLHHVKRRINGEPVAYILGQKEFWSLNLFVNESTLIPRPETELLVETALSLYLDDKTSCVRRVADLGTGTGAIALALASEKPHWQLTAIDRSQAACDLAEANRQAYGLDNVTIRLSHWMEALSADQFDMIVSNPPYIEPNDPHLTQGDVRYEPRSALVADNSGLSDIEIIADQAIQHLLPMGYVLIEHGYQQGEAVKAILQQAGFQQCRVLNDMVGHPRITLGQYVQQENNQGDHHDE